MLHHDRMAGRAMNPLGIPTPDRWQQVTDRLAYHRGTLTVDELWDLATLDQRTIEAASPGRLIVGKPPPWPLRPADVLLLRAGTAAIDLGQPSHTAGHGDIAAVSLHALPYWLPGNATWGLAHTDVPDDPDDANSEPWMNLRLPFPVISVWWSQRVGVDGTEVRPEWMFEWYRDNCYLDGGNVMMPDDMPNAFTPIIHTVALTDGIADLAVLGVTMFADDGGHPSDVVIWHLAVETTGGPLGPTWLFVPVPGLRSEAGWWQFLESVTAVVAWGDWVPDAPIVIRNRGKLRRMKAAGIDLSRLGPVRCLDSRRVIGQRTQEPERTHASPVTHIRRGHFRRQRVGPRSEERHELRWIPPTIVNPGGIPDDRPTVVTLPRPEGTLRNRLLARRAQGR